MSTWTLNDKVMLITGGAHEPWRALSAESAAPENRSKLSRIRQGWQGF
jgi:hypothetical protein